MLYSQLSIFQPSTFLVQRPAVGSSDWLGVCRSRRDDGLLSAIWLIANGPVAIPLSNVETTSWIPAFLWVACVDFCFVRVIDNNLVNRLQNILPVLRKSHYLPYVVKCELFPIRTGESHRRIRKRDSVRDAVRRTRRASAQQQRGGKSKYQRDVRFHTPNEKEISHGRVSSQARIGVRAAGKTNQRAKKEEEAL